MKKLFLSWLLLLPLISRSAEAQLSLSDFIAQQEKDKIRQQQEKDKIRQQQEKDKIQRDPEILKALKLYKDLKSMNLEERNKLRDILKRAVAYIRIGIQFRHSSQSDRYKGHMRNADDWACIASSMKIINELSSFMALGEPPLCDYSYTNGLDNDAGQVFLYFPTLEEAETFYGGPGTHHLQKIMDEMTKFYDSSENKYDYYEKIHDFTIEKWLNALSLPELPESQQ